MNRKRRFLSAIFKEKQKRQCTMGINPEKEEVTNIEAPLLMLKSMFPVEKFQRPLPPIIMKHQIYAFVGDRTEADKQLNEMRKRGKIRIFRLGLQEDEFAIVFLDDYINHVQQCCEKNSVVGVFLNCVVKSSTDVCFGRDVLMEQYCFKEENIRELVKLGLLVLRDVGYYWLSIPMVGDFIKTFMFGRRATLQYVRRTKYREILQSELEQRKLPRKAVLGIPYHIYDLIGSELVTCLPTATGKMLRLPPESSSS